MHIGRFSNMKVKRYSKFVCSAVDLGVSLDDLIFETKKYHGMEFGNRVESAVKAMMEHR